MSVNESLKVLLSVKNILFDTAKFFFRQSFIFNGCEFAASVIDSGQVEIVSGFLKNFFELSIRVKPKVKAENGDVIITVSAFTAIVFVRAVSLDVMRHTGAVTSRAVTTVRIRADVAAIFSGLKELQTELIGRDRLQGDFCAFKRIPLE